MTTDDVVTPPHTPSAGVRAAWSDLPEHVRAGIGDLLGSPVVQADNQHGGFSPGLAARVRCEDGARAFVKAAGTVLNADTPGLYRQEARIAASLPGSVAAPRFRGSTDDGDWVVLAFDEIDGRMPHEPWRSHELDRAVVAITELSRSLTPSPVDDLTPASTALRGDFVSYSTLAGEPPTDLDPWEARHLDRLAELALDTLDRVDGSTLVHGDLRADNILLTDDGGVWFVDWPWAFRGAAWLDIVFFLINAALHGHEPERYLDDHPLLHGVDPEAVTGALAGICGMFAVASRRPAPPGLPTLREFQRAQYVVTLDWIRRRTGWA